MDDLNSAPEFGRPARRPVLMATCFVAIGALALSGLYQGFRFTWRDYGPAPSYPQIASAATPDASQAVPISQPTSPDAPLTARRQEVADNDATPLTPTADLASTMPQTSTDGPPPPPASTATEGPTDRDAVAQPTAYYSQQNPILDPSAPIAAPGATSPANSGPGRAPGQPQP